jgi:hypothetical protein
MQVARCMPWVLTTYKLDELTTVAELRRNLNKLFKQNAPVRSAEVVDLLIYKGREELEVSFTRQKGGGGTL